MGAAHLTRAVRSPHSSRLLQTAERRSSEISSGPRQIGTCQVLSATKSKTSLKPQASPHARARARARARTVTSRLVTSALGYVGDWERHAHEAESHGNTIGHSPRHVPSFSLSESLSLSHTVSHFLPLLTSVPQPRLFFVVFASVRIHLLYIYILHPKSTDALCWYCAVLYCMKHEA